MININVDVLQAWVASMFIPLTRILGFVAIAPLFSGTTVSIPIKVAVGILLTLIVAPMVELGNVVDLVSFQGALVILQQLIIGFSIGFVMRILFSAVDLAGQLSGLTMGFGFATFFDPQSGGSTTVITTMLSMLFMLVFISMNGHLMMISALIESFDTLPVQLGLGPLNGMSVARLGSSMFSTGLQIAMPVVATLLVTNMALGVLTRSAPQLNIFGIGFPITIGVGFFVLMLILPSLSIPFQLLIERTGSAMQNILRGNP
jgi:flagellar biosynthetic protein FliR